jgi:hypothetical protein
VLPARIPISDRRALAGGRCALSGGSGRCHEKAPPLLDEIRTHILEMSKTVLPSSAPGQACRYTLAIWKKLIRFLDYPELELSNNLAENSMRPIAIGRSLCPSF